MVTDPIDVVFPHTGPELDRRIDVGIRRRPHFAPSWAVGDPRITEQAKARLAAGDYPDDEPRGL